MATRFLFEQDFGRPGPGVMAPSRAQVEREQSLASARLHGFEAGLAEGERRASGLNWSILRLGFVYGEGDGHLEALPRYFASGIAKLHPAARMSVVHHRDVAGAVNLALTGALDGHVVNVSDDAPTTFFELFEVVGEALQPSAEPLINPWHGHMDNTRARSLGFRPTVNTVHQAVLENLM